MRVLLACDWFLKYAAEQSAGLARQGAETLLLCRTHSLEFGGESREREHAIEIARQAGVNIVEIPRRVSDPRALPGLALIRRRIARFAPQVVHAHEGVDPRTLLLVPRLPTVLTIHDPVLHPGQPVSRVPKRWFLHGARGAWRARASAIVVHSERLRADIAVRGSQQCAVIAHGLGVHEHPLPPPTDRVVGLFGRLEPYKGLEVLADAMPRVWSVRPDVELRVSGFGDSELPLQDPRVHIDRRYIGENEVAAFFERSSLAVLPYTHATQTGVGSAAVGYGVPVIASRLGGLPELTLDSSYVFAPGDAAGLAAAIVAHIDDGPEVRKRVLAHVAAPRSWDAVSTRTLQLYESLLKP